MGPSYRARVRGLPRRQWLRAAGGAVGAIALAPVVTACGVSRNGRSRAGGAHSAAKSRSGEAPRRGGSLILRSFADASILDYAFNHDVYSGFIIGNCVETLVTHNAQALAVGLLAESWENPDEHTYVFRLRPGVRFQDGTDLVGDAVEYSMNRIRGDTAAFRHQDLLPIDQIEKPDAATVKVTLTAPFAPFLEKLTADAGRVISRETGEGSTKDRLKTDLTGQGSGPFRFQAWRPGDQITLARNESYWGRDGLGAALPYLDRLVVRVVPDGEVALAALRNGELDAFRPDEGPPSQETAAVMADPALAYTSFPGLGFSYIAFNGARQPFNSKELRQAVSYTVDRQAIVKSVFFDTAIPLDVIFAPSIWTSEPDYHPYLRRDLGRARQLLAQAGRPNGFGFTYLSAAGDPNQRTLAELLKDQLADAGIEMMIQERDFAALTRALSSGAYEAGFLGWTATYDPDDWVYSLFSTKGSLVARSHYSNATVDLLLDQARTTLDPGRRKPLYQQAQHLIADDAVVCVLCDKSTADLSRRAVRNLSIGPTSAVGLSQVWKES